jgi:hypothetical protein
MWRMIPDIDLLDRTLANQSSDWIVITLRGIGEMGGNPDPNQPKTTGSAPSWVDLSAQTDEAGVRRAWVNLVPTPDDLNLWNVMDGAAIALAKKLANDDPALIQYFYTAPGKIRRPPSASCATDWARPITKPARFGWVPIRTHPSRTWTGAFTMLAMPMWPARPSFRHSARRIPR